jgi:two-component system sensor histidine kinase BaeS
MYYMDQNGFLESLQAAIMRTRLSLEIFGAFLLASLLMVVLTIGALRFFFYSGFRDYVYKRELQKLPYLGRVLEEEYARQNGWDHLSRDPGAWRDVLEAARELEREEDSSGDGENGLNSGKRQRPEGHRFPWLFLLDEDKRPVIGDAGDDPPKDLLELELEGKTVGWIGLNISTPRRSHLEAAFLEQQYRIFYCLGGSIFLLTVVVTFILSRRLLAPIRKLMEGTQALASRRFNARIKVRSRNELGRLAEDFNRMAETLEAYEAMRRDWLSDISHELRTPLSILQGEIQAIQDGIRPLSPEAVESLKAEVDRLAKLVESLHFLSLADSESLVMRRDRIQPIRVLCSVVDEFREAMTRAGIALRLDIQGTEALSVTGDADQLGRVFSNLLQNTLQYTDSPGSLEIRAARRGGRLQITFEDSAPGVPDEALGRLFDRLFRVDKSRSRALGGSGLGLSIAKRIVEALGGSIMASHGAMGGLEITVSLPLDQRRI